MHNNSEPIKETISLSSEDGEEDRYRPNGGQTAYDTFDGRGWDVAPKMYIDHQQQRRQQTCDQPGKIYELK